MLTKVHSDISPTSVAARNQKALLEMTQNACFVYVWGYQNDWALKGGFRASVRFFKLKINFKCCFRREIKLECCFSVVRFGCACGWERVGSEYQLESRTISWITFRCCLLQFKFRPVLFHQTMVNKRCSLSDPRTSKANETRVEWKLRDTKASCKKRRWAFCARRLKIAAWD